MCGICGEVDPLPGKPVDGGILGRMNVALSHRGPDDSGQIVKDGWGLAMRRLSIIDLTGGHQPIANEDKSAWIVFNGEIYNFAELRRFLEGKGHRFATRTDTEVVLHLWEEKGEACVKDLNGMFAFALWDDRRGRLF